MKKFFNSFFLIISLIYFFFIFNYYFSEKNVKDINMNRSNFKTNLSNNITELPILENDTNNIIEFNSSFSNDIKNKKPRNFWNLFKDE